MMLHSNNGSTSFRTSYQQDARVHVAVQDRNDSKDRLQRLGGRESRRSVVVV